MVFPVNKNCTIFCNILKQRKLKTDIYGKDCKEIDGFDR